MEAIDIYKGFKFRLYPNNMQSKKINKNFGYNRFVYNYYLAKIIKEGYKSTSYYIKDYTTRLKYKYQFLWEADPMLIKKIIFKLEDNYKKYINGNSGYLKYKSKYNKNSYTINIIHSNKTIDYKNIKLDLENKLIKLPNLGNLEIRGYRNLKQIDGRIINYTISREKNGKYYIAVLYELSDIQKVTPETIVGLDLGIKKLITLSSGKTYENNRYITKYEEKIKREQKNLSRKQKGSKNYYKNIKKLNGLYIKLSNNRRYYNHKITKEITENYDIISTESLTISKMIMDKEHHLSKAISDATFNEILEQLEYKAKERGKYFYKISPYYPSSQICSVCNNIDKKYKNLDERMYECNRCYSKLDRDFNASVNIMFEGLKLHIMAPMKNLSTR